MIKVCINTYGDCGHVEYCVELDTTADWARTPQETAVGLLFEGAEQVSRQLNVDRPESQPSADEVPLEDPEQERKAQLIVKVMSGEIKGHTDHCTCSMGKVGCSG